MGLRCEIRSVWTRSSVTIQGRNATLLLPTPNGSLRKQKALLVGDTELKASSQGKPPESLHRQQQRTGSPKEVDDFCGWNELLGLFCAVAVVGELLGTGHIAASGGEVLCSPVRGRGAACGTGSGPGEEGPGSGPGSALSSGVTPTEPLGPSELWFVHM